MSVVIVDLKDAKCCVDCKFAHIEYHRTMIYPKWIFQKDKYGPEELSWVGCRRVIFGDRDIITGEDVSSLKEPALAHTVRTDGTLCGLEGRWFEPLDGERPGNYLTD